MLGQKFVKFFGWQKKYSEIIWPLKNTNQQITGKYNLLAKQKQEVENSTKLLAAEKENLSSEVQKHKNETAALNR